MPAADINSVSVSFGFGVKREEFGPVKKAEVTISASVPEDHDGVIALDYISKVARDKIGELLGLGAPQSRQPTVDLAEKFGEPQPDQGRGQLLPPAGDTGEPEATAPTRRRRRTNAEIEADNAAAAAKGGPAPDQPAEAAPPASEPGTATEAGSTATGDATASDEWDTPASVATITDEAILSATSAAAGKLGKREPILDLKETYRNLDLFPADQKFGITDIPQAHRQDYLDKLAKLTA